LFALFSPLSPRSERDIVDWHNDPGAIARKDLVAVNAMLFFNKTNVSGAVTAVVEEQVTTAQLDFIAPTRGPC
jgi:exo-beta-1,3-glucanase (GH17 family)